jgi:hypothetical protein
VFLYQLSNKRFPHRLIFQKTMQQNHSRSFSLVGVTDFGVFVVSGFHEGKGKV